MVADAGVGAHLRFLRRAGRVVLARLTPGHPNKFDEARHPDASGSGDQKPLLFLDLLKRASGEHGKSLSCSNVPNVHSK